MVRANSKMALGLKFRKGSCSAKSKVVMINDQPAAPVWYMSHMIKGGGLESFMPIKMKFNFIKHLYE